MPRKWLPTPFAEMTALEAWGFGGIKGYGQVRDSRITGNSKCRPGYC